MNAGDRTKEVRNLGKPLDLLGKKFGTLTVVEQLDERKNRYCVWLCQCNCGKKIKANTKELTQGQAFCAECSPKKNMKKGPIAENLAGQRFGKLQVLQRAENRKGRTAWLCQVGDSIVLKLMAYEPETYYSAGSITLTTTVVGGIT